MFSPLPFAWFLMHPFTVLVLRTTVRFLSPFPDSLPQLFLRCLLLVLTFRIVRLAFIFFRPCPLDFRLLSFLFLPFCSSRCHLTAVFSMHPFHFHFQDLPVTLCLISHAFLHGSLTRLYCWFLFVLPCFAPAAVPQAIPFWISSWGQMHDFCFLSSTSALASHYLALCFFRSISSCFRLTVTSSVLVFHFRFLRLPLYLSPNLLWLPSRFLYLAFCLFLFALPWFTPTAVSQVIPLCFRFRDFPLPVHFLSSVSFSLPATWLSVPSVLFFLALPHSGFSNVSFLPFGFFVFPILSCLISHAFLLGSDTWLSVCFLSSFPVSLPQLFHRCFPLSTFLRPFLCRDFLLAFSFLSSASARFWLLSILHFLFPSSWLPPCSGSHQCLSSSSVQPVSMLSFRLWYSAFCDSFLRSLFRFTELLQCLSFFLTEVSWFPLACALGSG